jgi:hypothetical protein
MSTIETSLCQRDEDLTREKGRPMSVMVTTRLDSLPGADQDAALAAPGRCPLVGAVLLDQMAAIAGPTWAPDHERAWSAAFELVLRPMLAGAAEGELAAAARAAVAPEQRVLAVEFRSADGRRWNAVGGGATVTAAILDASEGLPEDASWEPVKWNDLYGD